MGFLLPRCKPGYSLASHWQSGLRSPIRVVITDVDHLSQTTSFVMDDTQVPFGVFSLLEIVFSLKVEVGGLGRGCFKQSKATGRKLVSANCIARELRSSIIFHLNYFRLQVGI